MELMMIFKKTIKIDISTNSSHHVQLYDDGCLWNLTLSTMKFRFWIVLCIHNRRT